MGFYRWSLWQLGPILLSYFVAAGLAALPSTIGQIITAILPGWITSYTPSMLIYSWFYIDRVGNVHYAWNGRFAPGWTSDGAKMLQAIISGISAISGYFVLVNQAFLTISGIQSALLSGGLGGIWGYVCGYISNRNTGGSWW